MGAKKPWFEVDKEGLARLLKRRGIEFAVFELIQNAWDELSTEVLVSLTFEKKAHGRGFCLLTVEDDNPNGFDDLRHAFTLFADSKKKTDPEKRGRFNLGEKLVLALAEKATIATTTGTVLFKGTGRSLTHDCRVTGSEVSVLLPMSMEERDRVCREVDRLIPPPEIMTIFNGVPLKHREIVAEFKVALQTDVADAEGYLRRTTRTTAVRVYEPREGEVGTLYELGIPVVETGDRWHYDVQQKVPLNLDRDNVPPSYLRTLRTFAFNALHEKTTAEDCNAAWVRDALTDERVTEEAVKSAVEQRFGKKVVAFDPSDPEANKLAMSKGYTVVYGKQMSKAEWGNVKKAGLISPAGVVTPSPKPFSEDGVPLKLMSEENWTKGMREVAAYARQLAKALLGTDIKVRIANDFGWHFGAAYGLGSPLTLNYARLGKHFFENGITDEVVELLIHEFGHHYSSDHLSSEYHKALCRLGAKIRHFGHLA